MAETNAGGFFYTLNVKSNLKDTQDEVAGFTRSANLAGRAVGFLALGFGSIALGANSAAKQIKQINTLSTATGASVKTIRQLGTEFKLLGFEAEQGENLVANLQQQLIDYQQKGVGNFEELGRLGINIADISNVDDFTNQLREAFLRDPNAFRANAQGLGLSNEQIGFFSQSADDFQANRAIALSFAEDYAEVVSDSTEAQKEFNKQLGILTTGFSNLGLEIKSKLLPATAGFLKLLTGDKETYDTIQDKILNEGFNAPELLGFKQTPEQREQERQQVNEFGEKYVRPIASGVVSALNFFGADIPIGNIGSNNLRTSSTTATQSGVSQTKNDNRSYTIQVASPQQANELIIYNEAQGGI